MRDETNKTLSFLSGRTSDEKKEAMAGIFCFSFIHSVIITELGWDCFLLQVGSDDSFKADLSAYSTGRALIM